MVYIVKGKKIIEKTLHCKVCGASRTIIRSAGRDKKTGHVKHMWCINCGVEQPFEEE